MPKNQNTLIVILPFILAGFALILSLSMPVIIIQTAIIIICLLVMVYGGVLQIKAGGSKDKKSAEARDILIAGAIGLIIGLLSILISSYTAPSSINNLTASDADAPAVNSVNIQVGEPAVKGVNISVVEEGE